MNAEASVIEEFGSHYHNDVVDFGDEFFANLPNLARGSALRLGRGEVSEIFKILRSLKDRESPLHTLIALDSHVGWTDDDESWSQFNDIIDAIIAALLALNPGVDSQIPDVTKPR